MLLTVNRLGSTNISLRRFGRRRRRLSSRGCGGRAIGSATVAQLLYTGALAERGCRGIARFQLGHSGQPFSAAGIDIENRISREAVPPQRRPRALAELQPGQRVALEQAPGRGPVRPIEEEHPRAAILDESVAVEAH